jgi:DNA invertase Pin-like site-specific DNA recombinase
MPEPQKVAAAYLRRSKDDPRLISIGRQRDMCLAPAKAHGYEISEDCIFVTDQHAAFTPRTLQGANRRAG